MSELCVLVEVQDVTQCRDIVFVICTASSVILRYSVKTHQRLTDIVVVVHDDPVEFEYPDDSRWLEKASDIAACEQTGHVYIVDVDRTIWRVSTDGADIRIWLHWPWNGAFEPYAVSVTSGRLLVTQCYWPSLRQYDADGNKLRDVVLVGYMYAYHAEESPTGTYIVSHYNHNLDQFQVSEVDARTGGEMNSVDENSGSRLSFDVAVDSRGNILLADSDSCHVLLYDAHFLLRRVIVDEHQLNYKQPLRLSFREQSGQLLVVVEDRVALFEVYE